MIAQKGRVVKKFKLSKRLVALVVAAVLIVSANLFLTKRTIPFQRLHGYQTAAQMIENKNWNWGLAFIVSLNQGEVTLDHLGNLENNGIFIPNELAQVTNLQLDAKVPPIVLSAEDSFALRQIAGTSATISKTRCLNRGYKYCEVDILTNDSINDSPKRFVGVRLSANVFGLVEAQLLEKVIGQVN